MAFRDAQLANEQLSNVLTEAHIANLQGQVDVDAANRKGWGSFGEVYVGQYNGIVSRTTCVSAGGLELIPKFPQSVCVKTLREISFTEDQKWEKFLRVRISVPPH